MFGKFFRFVFLVSLMLSAGAQAVTCTSVATQQTDWNKSTAWDAACAGQPPVGATVIIAAGTSILADATTLNVADITVQSGGILAIKTGKTISLSGNLTNSGTFTAPAGSTVSLTGGSQTITGNVSFANLNLGTTALTLAGNVVVTGTLSGTQNLTSTCPANYTITNQTTGAVQNSCAGSSAATCIPMETAAGPTPVMAGNAQLNLGANTVINSGGANVAVTGVNNGIPVTGVTVAAAPALPALMPSVFPAAFPGQTTATLNTNKTVAAGSYGTVNATGNPTQFSGGTYYITTLNATGSIELAAGTYYIDTLKLSGNLTVTGAVQLFIGNKLDVKNNNITLNAGGNAGNLRVNLYSGAQFNAGVNNVSYTGLIYSPFANSKVTFKNNATIVGAVITAGKVSLKNNTVISYNATVQAQLASVSCASSAAPHHIVIEHDGSGQTCRAEVLTIKACANAQCTSYFTGATVTGNVTWAGSPGGSIPFTISNGGISTVSLPVTTAQTVTLSTAGVVPAQTNPPSSCVNLSGGGACSLAFAAATACFDTVEVGASTATPLFTKLSGRAFSLDVVAGSTYSGTLTVELVDSSAGSCSTHASLATQSATFNKQLRQTLSFAYPSASAAVKVRVAGLAGSSCSTDKFAIRPQSLTITSSANAAGMSASGAPVVKAGGAFTLDAASAITSYNGAPVAAPALLVAHTGALTAGVLSGAFAPASTSTGTASGSFTYDEVGYFKFDVNGVYDDTFTVADQPNDCINTPPDDFSNVPVGGKYGCKFGNPAATGYFGRFIPDHFETVVTQGCGNFSYSGQPLAVTIYAKDAAGGTTENYNAAYSKAVQLSDANNAASPGSFAPATISAGSFSAGQAQISPGYTFTAVKTAPTLVGVRAAEAAGNDNISSATSASGVVEGAALIRSGRVAVGNAYGSELLNLSVPVFAQYWSGTAYVTNVDDDVSTCTRFVKPVLALQSGTPLALTMPVDPLNAANVGFAAGDGTMVLTTAGAGYADVLLTGLPAWLPANTARATFGVYGRKPPFVYRGRHGR